MNSNPICHLSPVKKLNPHILIMFNFWCWPDVSMDSNPIHHPSPANKMKCSFLDYVHFWWSARLVDGLKPHLPPLSSQKNEMLIFWLCSLLMIGQAGQWTQTPSTTPLQPKKKMKCSFLDYVQLLIIGQAGWWTRTSSTTPLTQKNEMLIFGLCSTSDVWLSCLIVLNPIHHPSPAKNIKCLFLYNIQHLMLARLVNGHKPHLPPLFSQKMKCSFLDYIQLLMIGCAGQWTQTPSSTSLQPKKWNAHFCIMFNFWCWPDWSMDSNPIHHPSPAKKNEMLVFGLCSLLMICLADWWTWTPSATPLLPKKWNAPFSNTFNFYWSARLVDGLKPHLPPLSHQKNEMLIFGLCSTSDDQPGWSMASNPICHPSPANKMKCSFWIKFNFWWSARLVDGLKPHSPPFSSQKKWNAHFLIMFNFWWLAGLVDGLKPHPPLLSSQKLKCSFLDYVHFWWLAGLVDEPEPHLPPLSSQKNEMLIFQIHSTSDDQPG